MELSAEEYNYKYGVPADSIYLFPLEVKLAIKYITGDRCVGCGKRRRRSNLEVVHIKSPIPSDPRYDPNMIMDKFRRIGNATLLCLECEKALKNGDTRVLREVHIQKEKSSK